MTDVFELARANGVVEGQLPFHAAPRLRAVLRSTTGAIDYRLEGRVDGLGRPAARLVVRADLPLTCDRCAQLMTLRLEHEGTFYFVQDENELATLPVTVEDEAEPLLGSNVFDVAALAEDETILSLPVSPRHAECPLTTDDQDAPASVASENPFAVLPGLLRKNGR